MIESASPVPGSVYAAAPSRAAMPTTPSGRAARPLIRRIRTLSLNAVAGVLALAARVAPRRALQLAALAGRTAHALGGYGSSPRQVSRLYRDASPSEARRYARELAASEFRTIVFEKLIFRAPRAASRIVELENPDELLKLGQGSPKVFITWHSGPIEAFSIALDRLGIPATIFRYRGAGPSLPLVEAIPLMEGDDDCRAVALRRGVAALREGKVVGIAVDGESGAMAPPAPCLGRLVPIRRGATIVARLAGADIYLATAVWTRRSTVRVALQERLDADARSADYEAEVSRAFGASVERVLLRHRDALRPGKVRLFGTAPLA